MWTRPNRSLVCDSNCASERLLLEVLRGTETDTFLFLLSRPGCNRCCSHTCYRFNLPLCLRGDTQQHVFASPVKLALSVVAGRQRGRACARTLPLFSTFLIPITTTSARNVAAVDCFSVSGLASTWQTDALSFQNCPTGDHFTTLINFALHWLSVPFGASVYGCSSYKKYMTFPS